MCGAAARSQARQGRVVVVTTVVHPSHDRRTHPRTIRNTLIRGVGEAATRRRDDDDITAECCTNQTRNNLSFL